MYGQSQSQRVTPLGWILTLGLASLAALGVCRLFGVQDLFGALRVIVLVQAFVVALGVLFLIVIDTVAGPDREREDSARRALWFGRNDGDSQIWDEAVQTHLRTVNGEIAATQIPHPPATRTEGARSTHLQLVEGAEQPRSVSDSISPAVRRAPSQSRTRRAA